MDVDENNAEADSGEQQPPGTKIGSIPISLKIEVGQIRMSLEKRSMELQPGATLPLNIIEKKRASIWSSMANA